MEYFNAAQLDALRTMPGLTEARIAQADRRLAEAERNKHLSEMSDDEAWAAYAATTGERRPAPGSPAGQRAALEEALSQSPALLAEAATMAAAQRITETVAPTADQLDSMSEDQLWRSYAETARH